VIRHPKQNGKVKVTLILRDETGRYVWNSELIYNELKFSEPPNNDIIVEPLPPRPSEEVDENLLNSLGAFLGPKEKNIVNAFIKATADLVASEDKLLIAKKFGLDIDISLKRTPPIVFDDKLDPTSSRLLLSHLGISALNNYDELFSVQRFNDPLSRFNYLQNFANLDKTREREVYKVGIIRAESNQDETSIFENQGGSEQFTNFINAVGWMVNLNEHTGFSGGLDPKVSGNKAPYFANYDYEVIFQVSTLMPNKEKSTKQIHKTRLIKNNSVLISWVEDLEGYNPPTESTHKINIIVHPLPSQLFLIKIKLSQVEPDKPALLVGPLVDNMVVSKHILGTVVRQTTINAAKAFREDTRKPVTIRKFLIEDFINRNKVEQPVHHYFASQFAC